MNKHKTLLRLERQRILERPFAWIPFRLLKDGIFADLSDRAKLFYFFLCLAADSQGTSFYGDHRIQTFFQLDPKDIGLAKSELIHKDLIAYDGRTYQVLSLPSPRRTTAENPPPIMTHRTSEPESFAELLKRLAQKTL